MKNSYIYIIAIFLGLTIISCEDTIEVDSGFETSQIVIDAWLDTRSETQTITITESQDYFDNRLPTPINDAVVEVSNGINTYTFNQTEDGVYQWTPGEFQSIATVGDDLELSISVGGQTLKSNTSANRVPEVDSISIFYEDEAFGADPGLFAEIYARDLPGKGDTYWIKSYRNDTLLNRPQELNILYDATFDAGTDIDGTTFIRPLRFAVNALDDDGLPRDLEIGEKVSCEIHSISNEAFRFLQAVQEQTTNGDNGIFTLPIANSKGNIYDEGGERVLGMFNVANISSASRIVE